MQIDNNKNEILLKISFLINQMAYHDYKSWWLNICLMSSNFVSLGWYTY